MKNVLILFILICLGGVSIAQPDAQKLSSFYSKIVERGKVNYAEAQLRKNELIQLISYYENNGINDHEFADLINLYNLQVIKLVAENLPIQSVNEIPQFFDKKTIKLGDEQFGLNDLEGFMLEKFEDPRLHFVLVCGAVSCPPLRENPFTPLNLNEQLEKQTKRSLSDGNFLTLNEADKKVAASQIFLWYAADFGGNENIVAFIDKYLEESIKGYTLNFYPYDWSLNEVRKNPGNLQNPNIQSQTPSRLFNKHSWEFKTFSNLYSQTAFFDGKGSKTPQNNRSSYLTFLNQFLYGVTDRLNVGLEGWAQSATIGPNTDSPFRPYLFQNGGLTKSSFTYLGPKIKYQLFKKLPNLSLQSSFMAPIGQDLDGSEDGTIFLAADRFLWLTQVFYDVQLNQKWNLFFQLAPWVSLDRDGDFSQNKVETPVSVFLSYFPTDRWTIYAQQEFWPTWGTTPVLSAFFRQEGFGVKYQVIKGALELEASNTYFTSGMNQGAGYTLNFGVRWVKFR